MALLPDRLIPLCTKFIDHALGKRVRFTREIRTP